MKLKILFLVFVTTSLFSLTSAAEGIKPGLWEHSIVFKSQSGDVEKSLIELKKSLEKMPPEQRKMVEDMMAKNGMGLGKETTIKLCLTKEQAENLDIPHHQDSNCKQEVLNRTAKNIKTKFTCTGNPSSTGEADFTIINASSYTGKAFMNTDVNGKKDRLDMDQKGKWLSANCGAIEPIKTQK